MTTVSTTASAAGMLGSVLVATDFSRPADAATRRAAALPLRAGARVLLLHVLPPKRPSSHGPRVNPAVRDNLEAMAARLSRRAARRVGARPINVIVRVVRGRTHERIAETAREENVDLIVLGRHGQRPLADLFGLGSTADRVLRTSSVPVLVVSSAKAIAYRRPLVAIDLPPGAPVSAAMRIARRVVPPHARWTVLHVREFPYLSALQLGMASKREMASAARMLSRHATDAATRFATKWLSDTSFDIRVLAGDPRVLVPERVGLADLLVVGTHARRGLERMLLGSVTDAALRGTRCDVLVAPAPAR